MHLQYLSWRVITGRNQQITISFLPTGHTKFSPDWCFGLFKQKFRRTEIGCLEDLARCIEASASVNKAQLVGTSSGEILVPTYNWAEYLGQYFEKIKFITKYHHFHIDINKPGKIYVREAVDGAVQEIQHVSNMIGLLERDVMPPTISPRGLSSERQWYLYDKIREYCPENSKDKTCPLPEVPRNVPEEISNSAEMVEVVTEPRKKQPRVCGNCGLAGHNRRSCLCK